MSFPKDFIWGAATSYYQIEGAVDVDGRGESIWDRFCRVPGNIKDGSSGDRACEHYLRIDEDVSLMRLLNLDAYRFSIAWPRIQPFGHGKPNQKGIDFYRRLVDNLLKNGIAPFGTLYHWDLPQALEDEGGWVSRDIVERFADYARIVFAALPDVDYWVTHNEPWVSSYLGYAEGVKAPGLCDWQLATQAAHHLLLSHGRAVDVYRELRPAGHIGIVLDMSPCYGEPAAAKRFSGYRNGWFLDPIIRGSYPPDMVSLYESKGVMAEVKDGDLEIISRPIDFLGINYYQPSRLRHLDDGSILEVEKTPRQPLTNMGSEVCPEAFAELLTTINRDYDLPPIYITENGASYVDVVGKNFTVDDPQRLDYIRRHLQALDDAIASGVDVRGYFAWSLLDNFEWEQGYAQRFGIVYVDFETQVRIPKSSALWYADFIRQSKA